MGKQLKKKKIRKKRTRERRRKKKKKAVREVAGREGERIGFGEFDRERGAALNPKVRVGF